MKSVMAGLTGTLPWCKIKKVRQAAGNDLPFNSHGQLNVNHVVEQNEEDNHHDAKHRGFPVFHGNPPFWSMGSLQRQTALLLLCLIGAEYASEQSAPMSHGGVDRHLAWVYN